MIKDIFKDILRHTHALGFIEMVKISGDAESTTIEAMDADKTVILKGKLHNPVADFVEQTVGLSRMSVLDGYLKFPGFGDEGSNVSVETQERNGSNIPVEISFSSAEGHTGSYRFMLADVINQQLKDITFKGAEYDINILPSVKAMKDLAYFNGVQSGYEANFTPKTEDGALYFLIGDGASDRTKILIDNNVDGEITAEWNWPLDIVLKILRLGDNSNLVLSINNQGLLQIKVDSGLGVYTYLLPARR